jgi:hypothetical protein
MRPILALLLVVAILGGVQAYMTFQASLPAARPVQQIEAKAEGVFTADVTLTFDAEPDVFSLEPTSVLVLFRGTELLRKDATVKAGTPLLISDIPGMAEGRNEFYVKATPPEDETDQSRAVRVRVLRDGIPVAEHTLWSEPGTPVEGAVQIDVPRATQAEEHHDH